MNNVSERTEMLPGVAAGAGVRRDRVRPGRAAAGAEGRARDRARRALRGGERAAPARVTARCARCLRPGTV